MAPLDQRGVVSAQLRVHGIAGLRVCDASVFPKINRCVLLNLCGLSRY